jgi:hypothetical protein
VTEAYKLEEKSVTAKSAKNSRLLTSGKGKIDGNWERELDVMGGGGKVWEVGGMAWEVGGMGLERYVCVII